MWLFTVRPACRRSTYSAVLPSSSRMLMCDRKPWSRANCVAFTRPSVILERYSSCSVEPFSVRKTFSLKSAPLSIRKMALSASVTRLQIGTAR
ncbi:hypothetical protein NP493_528g02032 [Ridgeia piscesae]|uniref:Uncharacterized protein n=1 Tax=Ridgeia piscesae TaxID=27915 RepID=A0AAD9KWB8_RIDPI|nr:hypothetical protein NP493_528g02032 [Ridgeia piscesae]